MRKMESKEGGGRGGRPKTRVKLKKEKKRRRANEESELGPSKPKCVYF